MTVAYSRVYGNSHPPLNIPNPIGAGATLVGTFYEVVNITTAFANTNTVDVGYLPPDAICIGGYVAAEDLDTGTEVLDLDLGITANGVDSADPDFFMNGGVFTGDAITDFPFTNAANVRMLTGPFPVTQLGAKTLVQLKCNAAANAGGTGKIAVRIDYIVPGKSTS